MKKYFICFLLLLFTACGNNPLSLEQAESKFVTDTTGLRIHYKTAGSGEQTLVFVHGFGCDINAWQHQYGYFRDKARMLFIDLPGHGKSDKPHTEYTLDFFADAIKLVFDSEHIEGAVLVGHSLGTPVCRQAIFKYPELASALVDVDGVYCFYPADTAMIAAYNAFAQTFNVPDVKEVISDFVQPLCIPQTPQSVRDYALSVMPRTPQYVAYSIMKNLIEEKYWTQGEITLPTLVFASVNSQIPPDYEQILSPLYPNMEYHELDNIGHFIMMEQPEIFNKMLEIFLENF